jgi:hypothetical protein
MEYHVIHVLQLEMEIPILQLEMEIPIVIVLHDECLQIVFSHDQTRKEMRVLDKHVVRDLFVK